MRIQTLALFVAAGCLAIVARTVRGQSVDAPQATLLAKSDDTLIHAISLSPGHVIVRTVPSTGVMKPLLKTQAPVGRQVGDFIAGVAQDEHRLYVLLATDHRLARRLHLHAFWLADGSPLLGEGYDLGYCGRDDTAREIGETLGSGPLELNSDGVSCHGVTVRFNGRNVSTIEQDGKAFTPPPNFFDSRLRNL